MSFRPIKPARVLAAAVLLAAALPRGSASAQIASLRRDNMRFEVRPYVGAYIPTGDQRSDVESASLTGLQMSVAAIPRFALTLTFGVAQSNGRITSADRQLDIIQYDIGVEGRRPRWYRQARYELTPFIGAGLGGRTYEYANRPDTLATSTDGYGTVGAEIGFGLLGIRLEARDYISRVPSLTTTHARPNARNDLTVSLGVAFRLGTLGVPEANSPCAAR